MALAGRSGDDVRESARRRRGARVAPGASRLASLPAKEGTAPRPGPAVLYQPLARAPQLENAPGSVWHAPPILVSGASAYRSGEFLYQGYLYDDHGAKEVDRPDQPDDLARAATPRAATCSPNPTAPTPTRPARATTRTRPT